MSRPPKSMRSATGAPTPESPSCDRTAWFYLLIFAATLIAYIPALSAGFIWDDVGHVTRTDLRSLGGLGRIWFELGATQQYYPLLHSAFWVEHLLWGDAPFGYHFLNMLLHATNACLFATVLRRLFDSIPDAPLSPEGHSDSAAIPRQRRFAGVEWLAALLFALHPICVESVAWISEQKNTLSAAFYLSAALAFLRFASSRKRSDYALASTLFIAALLTKTVTATLPAALLVVFWWLRGRMDWRREVLPLLPWFALSAASGLLTAYFERKLIGAEGTDFTLTALERGLLAGRVAWFYLGKLVWPAELIFIYPRWTIDATQVWQWLFPLGALGLLGFLILRRRNSRAPLAALLLFGGTLFPVLGFLNVYPFLFSYVADHFQYLASLPVFAIAAAGLQLGFARLRFPRWTCFASAGAVLATLGTLSFSQAEVYRSKLTLYEDTLARNPSAWMAHTNLATELAATGRLTEAIPHLEEALRLHPNYAQGRANLGDALVQLGQPNEAIPQLEEALRLRPDYAEAHNSLGAALVALGRTTEGVVQYEEALRLDPALAIAHRNLGLAIAASGRDADAIPHFASAAGLDPHDAQAELCWGIALMETNRADEALSHFARAVELAPDSPDVRLTYGRALASQQRMDAAADQFRSAVELDPTSPDAHRALALALRALGRSEESQEQFSEAQRLGAGSP
jgi:protein O-mannosyl-transferase